MNMPASATIYGIVFVGIKHLKYEKNIFLMQSSVRMMMKEGSSNTIVDGSTSGDTTACRSIVSIFTS
jgi:hypothetical protein